MVLPTPPTIDSSLVQMGLGSPFTPTNHYVPTHLGQYQNPYPQHYENTLMDKPIKTTSALAGVFGSTVSLAELAGGDDSSDYQTIASARQHPHRSSFSSSAGGASTVNTSSTSIASSNGRITSSGLPYQRRLSRSQNTHARSSSTNSVHISSFSSSKDTVPLSIISVSSRLVILFVFGVAYGQISLHLHDNHEAKQTIFGDDYFNPGLLLLVWGLHGIFLGALFPSFDALFPEKSRHLARGKGGHDWSSIVRALAAFTGVAYGIRKFAWTSTLQSAFYWGMVNPCLWYILDATRNGFILSSLVAILGTGLFAGIFPSHFPAANLNNEYLSVVAWVASVFFCCSICFGNLGRRLLSVTEN